MGLISKSADCVLSWLGLDENGEEAAIKRLASTARPWAVPGLPFSGPESNRPGLLQSGHGPLSKGVLDSGVDRTGVRARAYRLPVLWEAPYVRERRSHTRVRYLPTHAKERQVNEKYFCWNASKRNSLSDELVRWHAAFSSTINGEAGVFGRAIKKTSFLSWPKRKAATPRMSVTESTVSWAWLDRNSTVGYHQLTTPRMREYFTGNFSADATQARELAWAD
jgi:hypothetical protein